VFKGICRICGKYGHRGSDCFFAKSGQVTEEKNKAMQGIPPTSSQAKNDNAVPITCNYCKKVGHKKADCWKLKKKNEREGKTTQANIVTEVTRGETQHDAAMVSTMVSNNVSEPGETTEQFAMLTGNSNSEAEKWIGDMGASVHMTNSQVGLVNIRHEHTEIKLGDGKYVESSLSGDKLVIVKQDDGREIKLVLKNCKYVPTLFTNLLSLTKVLESGWELKSDETDIILQKR